MSPRILLLSASVGTGHNRAAQAIQLALQRTRPDAIVEYVDVLDDTNRAFRRMYGRGYFGLVDRAPHVVGYLYDRLDQPVKNRRMNRMRLSLSMMNLQRLVDRLTKQPWDLAICTHFLPAEIIATLRLAERISFPQAVVTTDFDTHRLWVNPPCADIPSPLKKARSIWLHGASPRGTLPSPAFQFTQASPNSNRPRNAVVDTESAACGL